MGLELSCLVPHPPILVPEIGGDQARRVSDTAKALDKLAQHLAEQTPEVIIAISPHAPVFSHCFPVLNVSEAKGDFGSFGCPQVKQSVLVDKRLTEMIIEVGQEYGLPVASLTETTGRYYGYRTSQLDHGFLVPFYFLRQQPALARIPCVLLGISTLPFLTVYRFGQVLAEAAKRCRRKAVLVASGDLSHRLTADAPAGFNPAGRQFDEKLVNLLKLGAVEEILQLDREFVAAAGECGLRPLIAALGALDGREVLGQVLSYEGPFGVGYAVALMKPGKPVPSIAEKLFQEHRDEIKAIRARESAPVRLARTAVEYYVTRKEYLPEKQVEQSLEYTLPPDLPERAGVFVSIKKDGELRGCIGTVEPTQSTLRKEICRNAVLAATHDPRFPPVEPEELADLVYSVDILSKPEPVTNEKDLDPARYGLIVRSGSRSGLLLPDLPGIDTVQQQEAIARRKAGIGPHEPVTRERFEVIRFR